MKNSWLFKKLNVSLRTEIIINISLLMLAAILLIGFTMFKVDEKNIIQEKINNGERMIRDFQATIDFILRNGREFPLSQLLVRKEIQDFVDIYAKERDFYDLMITDLEQTIIASKKKELIGKEDKGTLLRKSIQSGQMNTETDKSGGFLPIYYRKLTICSPLWIQGKVAGGIQMGIPIGDVMMHLVKSQRMILIAIVIDAVVLIAFGSFLLSHVLVRPLKDLVRLTQRISEGDFSQKIEATSKNEIGQLISSFNRMIERLKENQESLENYLTSLEMTNRKLKQVQEELIRAEKLASIGRFAAGVAHEVGNPLAAILGYTSILEEGGVNQEDTKDYLKRIEKEIGRINKIVRELLDFARPSRQEAHDVEINKVIENALSLASYQKNFRNVKTDLELQADLPLIRGDKSQLSQVFVNIIMNAVDAMPEGGILRIRTEVYVVEGSFGDRFQRTDPPRRRSDPEGVDYSHLRKPDPLSAILTKFSKGDRLVRLRISDTGVGIRKEDIDRIFDPFFTTKAPDRGTGLGLSVTLRIVESMGGRIRAESEVGKGSTFEVYFPVNQEIA
jgi:signal transduction histidine kinase